MKSSIAIAVAAILILASLPYVYQISRKHVLPTLSTWIILVVATSLNVASYLVATRADIVSGMLGLADAFVCWLILIVSVIATGLKMQFGKFETYCLGTSGVIVLFWLISRQAFMTNLLMQILITVGCSSTIQSLLYADENHESFLFWGLVLVAALLSLYPAAVDGNLLALIYSIRSILVLCVILFLMFRLSLKSRTVLRPAVQK